MKEYRVLYSVYCVRTENYLDLLERTELDPVGSLESRKGQKQGPPV